MKKLGYLPIILAGLAIIPALPALAINYNSGTYGSCQFDTCGITISSDGNVNLDVTPTPSGKCTVQSDTVAVFTDNSNGFSLTLSNNSTSTALVSGSATINATSATAASPATLPINQWGYRVDGFGSFGSGPTTGGFSVNPNATTFALVPASNQLADTIASTAVAADPTVNTGVWYGVCADTNITNGAYTTVITYSAVTN